jgi:hypothetical protein
VKISVLLWSKIVSESSNLNFLGETFLILLLKCIGVIFEDFVLFIYIFLLLLTS